MTEKETCEYLWNNNWQIEVVEEVIYYSVGDFLLILNQPDGPILYTSPGFSGIYYVFDAGLWYLGSTFKDLATI